jgi:hypothetical protein
MRRYKFLQLGCTLVAGCSIPQTIEFPVEPSLPVAWGEYSTVTIHGGSCPDISGAYAEVPEVKSIKGYDIENITGNRYSIYGLFPFEIAENSPVVRIDTKKMQSEFRFSQSTPGEITMTHLWANGEKIESSIFKASEQDFNCVDGFIQFPINSVYGQLEGVKINGQNRTRVRLAQDQSLIVVKSYGEYRSNSEASKSNFEHEFYRFKSVVNTH